MRRMLLVVLETALLFIPLLSNPCQGQVTERVNLTSTGSETQAGTFSANPSLSYDGRYVAYDSNDSSLVLNDMNQRSDVFVHDRQTGYVTRVSVTSQGTEATGSSTHPKLSGDGRFVMFQSFAVDLVPDDNNGSRDIFIHDRDADGNGVFDEPQAGATATLRVSLASSGAEADAGAGFDFCSPESMSSDGRFVVFSSLSSNLDNGSNGFIQTYVRDVHLGTTVLVSKNSPGATGNSYSEYPDISDDGRHVVFHSDANNLVPDDTNGTLDVFVHDRDIDGNGVFDEPDGTRTLRVSVGTLGEEGNDYSDVASVSSDGRFVVFCSSASNLASGDSNGKVDVFLRDRDPDEDGVFDEADAVETTLISSGIDGCPSDGDSCFPRLSDDARFLSFRSTATNLVSDDTNGHADVFLYDRLFKSTVRVSVSSTLLEANAPSCGLQSCSISGNGKLVGFGSDADNLVANDQNMTADIFVHDVILRCAAGTVGVGVGPPQDVLTVNGSTGNDDRVVTVPVGGPIGVTLNPAPNGPVGGYILWVWAGSPRDGVPMVFLPKILEPVC